MSALTRLKLRGVRAGARVLYGSSTVGSAVAVLSDDSILLVRDVHRRESWVLPGGFCRRGELPSDAAARELSEETGLQATFATPDGAALYDHRFRHVHFLWRLDFDLARHGTPTRRGLETLAVEWFPLTEARGLIEPGTRDQLQLLQLGSVS